MSTFVQMICAFFAVVGFGRLVKVPKDIIAYTGMTAAIGWMAYCLMLARTASVVLSNFFAALVIAVVSQILARIFKAPVTLFILPAMLTLVPGAGMYRIVYYALQGNSSRMFFYVIQTMEIAGAIAVAIFLADTVFRLKPTKKG